jgi:RNA polymerase sigma factor for flagellar operon FliA
MPTARVNTKAPTKAETLWKAYWHRRTEVHFNALVTYYTPYVKYVAHAVHAKIHCIEYDDMLQEGMIALCDCIQRFERKRKLQFMTFASTRVRGAMLDYVRHEDFVPRLEREREKAGTVIPKRTFYLSNPMYYDEEAGHYATFGEVLEDQHIDHTLLSDEVCHALRGCNTHERIILLLYYLEDLTMKQIGESLDLSESRISQIHSAVIRRIRKDRKTA